MEQYVTDSGRTKWQTHRTHDEFVKYLGRFCHFK